MIKFLNNITAITIIADVIYGRVLNSGFGKIIFFFVNEMIFINPS